MNNAKKLLKSIANRPIFIWGARMTGIGFYRFASQNNLEIKGFVDSDKSLHNNQLYGKLIYSPTQFTKLRENYKDFVVVIAVSIKEDEIVKSLSNIGISETNYILYKDYCQNFYTIDIVGTCNLRCPSCANSIGDLGRPKGLMSLADYRKILAKMMDEVGVVSHICLYNWGEPMLHPELSKFIDYTHSVGIAVAVSSNFSIGNEKLIYNLVKSSPDIFKISLSGYFKKTYDLTHTGGDINLVKSNLYRLKYYMTKLGKSFLVEVNYHLYKHNQGDNLQEMERLCKELGFILSTCYANYTPVERIIDFCEGNLDEKSLEFLKLYVVNIEEGLKIASPYRNLPCRFLSNQVNINWDRSVDICCVSNDGSSSTISDDYLEESLDEIIAKKNNHALCDKCMSFGIHQYLLGVNQKEWKKLADKKINNSIK